MTNTLQSSMSVVAYINTFIKYSILSVLFITYILWMISIPKLAHQTPLLLKFVVVVSSLVVVRCCWFVAICKTTHYTVDAHYIKIKTGVFTTNVYSYDLTKVRFCSISRPLTYRCFKKSDIILNIKGCNTPIILQALDHVLANDMFDLINNNAVENMTELMRKKHIVS